MKNSPHMSLRIWDEVEDLYSHEQLADNFAKLDIHDHTPGRGVQIPTNGIVEHAITERLLALESVGSEQLKKEGIEKSNLSKSLQGELPTPLQTSIIKEKQTRESTSYGTLSTPDEVEVEIPTNGLIAVAYQATWQESVAGAARAAIFVGANQLKIATVKPLAGEALPVTQAAATGASGAAKNVSLFSSAGGLLSTQPSGGYSGDVTTGQIVGAWNPSVSELISGEYEGSVDGLAGKVPYGGPCYIFAASGPTKISVQYKATSGKVSAEKRNLWLWVID
jgi:hypothetical protein